jgi:orotate phosphoribosyltransferase
LFEVLKQKEVKERNKMGGVAYLQKECEQASKKLKNAENIIHNKGDITTAITEFNSAITKLRDTREQLGQPSKEDEEALLRRGVALLRAQMERDVTEIKRMLAELTEWEKKKKRKNIKAEIEQEKAKLERAIEIEKNLRRYIEEIVAPTLLEDEKLAEGDIFIISNLAQEMLMREEGGFDEELYHFLEILKSLSEEDNAKKISKASFKKGEWLAEIKRKWESLYLSDEEFAKGWLLQAVTNELLKYSIEDDYVKIDDVAFEIIPFLQELIERNDWVNHSLLLVIKASRKLAKKEPLPTRLVEFRISTPIGICPIVGKVPLPSNPPIPVSSKSALFAPVLEDSIARPHYRGKIIDAFAERLVKLRNEIGVTCLCFIEKSAGPVGTLAMLSDLVSKTDLPACIYREGYLSKRTKLSGYQTTHNDKVAIVYDLIVTGHGIQQAANDIETKFRTTVAATVVLLSYDKEKRSTLEIGNGRTIRVESIGWYEDYVSEFERIQEPSVVETEHVKVLEAIPTNGETECPLVSGEGLAVSPPCNGGDKMVSSHHQEEHTEIDERDKADILPAMRSPAENLARIHEVLKPAMSDLVNLFGVSRQTIYNWQTGEQPSLDNAARLDDLAKAVDVIVAEGIKTPSQLVKRKLVGGKTLLETVRDGGSASEAAHSLVRIVKREIEQSKALESRLGRRKRAEQFYTDCGSLMLDEDA